jgi:hypothetical protein
MAKPQPAMPPTGPPVAVMWRQLPFAMAVTAVGLFMTIWGLGHPTGPHLRKLGVGLAAIVLGALGVFLSVGRACPECKRLLRTHAFRIGPGLVPALAGTLDGGDVPGTVRLLSAALGTRGGHGSPCSIAYCDGCRGLVFVTLEAGDTSKHRQVIQGDAARTVAHHLEATIAGGGA